MGVLHRVQQRHLKTIARTSLEFAFVAGEEKARLQKQLEDQFRQFEKPVLTVRLKAHTTGMVPLRIAGMP